MSECEYWDIAEFSRDTTSLEIRDGELFDIDTGTIRDFRLRAFHKGAWAFSEISDESAEKAELEKVKALAVKLSKNVKRHQLGPGKVGGRFSHVVKVHPTDVSLEKKLARCIELEKAARIAPNLNTILTYYDSSVSTLLRTSEGNDACEDVVRCGAVMTSIAREGSLLQRMADAERQTGGWEVVDSLSERFASECSKRAIALLKAKPAPSGKRVVVLDPLLLGTFIHEALGHASEGDLVANGESVLKGKLGTQIAPKSVSIFDDKTLKGGYGSYWFDRDGVGREKTAIVERGELVSFLNSRDSAGKLGTASTGNCRSVFNQVRMSNTVMAPGKVKAGEIIRDTRDGVYLVGSSGGQVEPTSGDFNFAALEGYLIKKGQLTQHLRDVSLLGNTLEILKKIDAVGSDFRLKSGVCGKDGEWMPVGAGGPTIRTVAVVGGKA